jgi:hypothetical protein
MINPDSLVRLVEVERRLAAIDRPRRRRRRHPTWWIRRRIIRQR